VCKQTELVNQMLGDFVKMTLTRAFWLWFESSKKIWLEPRVIVSQSDSIPVESPKIAAECIHLPLNTFRCSVLIWMVEWFGGKYFRKFHFQYRNRACCLVSQCQCCHCCVFFTRSGLFLFCLGFWGFLTLVNF